MQKPCLSCGNRCEGKINNLSKPYKYASHTNPKNCGSSETDRKLYGREYNLSAEMRHSKYLDRVSVFSFAQEMSCEAPKLQLL